MPSFCGSRRGIGARQSSWRGRGRRVRPPSPGWPGYPQRRGRPQPRAGGSALRHGGDRRFLRARSQPLTTGGDHPCPARPPPSPTGPLPRPLSPPLSPPPAALPTRSSPRRSPLPLAVKYRTSSRYGPAAAGSARGGLHGGGCWPPAWRWPPQHWPAELRTEPYEPLPLPAARRRRPREGGSHAPRSSGVRPCVTQHCCEWRGICRAPMGARPPHRYRRIRPSDAPDPPPRPPDPH